MLGRCAPPTGPHPPRVKSRSQTKTATLHGAPWVQAVHLASLLGPACLVPCPAAAEAAGSTCVTWRVKSAEPGGRGLGPPGVPWEKERYWVNPWATPKYGEHLRRAAAAIS